MGCMLILSNINGCNEIVQHKENGLLVPAKNSKELQQAMLSSRLDAVATEQYATAIRQKIKTVYDQRHLWELILQEYRFWLTSKAK